MSRNAVKQRIDGLTTSAKKPLDQVRCQDGMMATPCEYANMLGRCRFPGAMSQEIQRDGKWYCMFHYQQLYQGLSEEDAAMGVASKRKAEMPKDWRDDAIEAKIKEMKDDSMMQMAQTLAKEGCSRQDKADFLGLLRNRAKGIGQKLLYEKANRDPAARAKNFFEDIYE